jgi:hypothetical protein
VPRIFISYRREDSAGQAGRLNDRLCAAFGASQVFMDVDDIPPGENFVASLRRNVEAAEVALVLIGPKWLAASDEQGRRRLDDEADFVHREVSEALAQSKRVVPVLLNGTAMPAARDLPGPLHALAPCQAFELTDSRFDRDAAALIESLGGTPARPQAGQGTGRSVRRLWPVLGAAVVLAGLAAWWLLPERGVPGRHAARESVEPSPAPPPPAAVNADVTGTWEGEVFYEWDKRTVREPFSFRFVAGQLVGSAGFLGYPRGIVSGEVKGQTISFETRSQATLNDKPIEYVHRYRGDIAGDEIRMVMQTTGPYQSGVPREFVLRRARAAEGTPPVAKPAP